jgi:hypothetical protein
MDSRHDTHGKYFLKELAVLAKASRAALVRIDFSSNSSTSLLF